MLRFCLQLVVFNCTAGASCHFYERKYKILGECFVYIEEQCTYILNIDDIQYVRALIRDAYVTHRGY